jgi:hypothetical protein
MQYSLILMNIDTNGSLAKCPASSFRDSVFKSKIYDIIYLTIVRKGLIRAFGFLQSQ